MPDFKAPRRVRLNVDLTRYDPRCLVGSEGITTRSTEGFAGFDHFTEVVFDSGARLPIVWESLVIVEPEVVTATKKETK